jgi:glycerol kinase
LEADRDQPAITQGLVFVPALSGLACPYWDRTAAGMWIGMTHATRAEDLARAVLEGVALQTAMVLDEMARWIRPGSSVSVDGGLANSEAFCRFLATVLQREVTVPHVTELTLLGAAKLAGGDDEGRSRSDGAGAFAPEDADPGPWRKRFADAMERSRGWRR